MRKVFTALFVQIAAMLAISPAVAQEAMTLDQRVNEAFAAATGPFVSLILRPFQAPAFPGL